MIFIHLHYENFCDNFIFSTFKTQGRDK